MKIKFTILILISIIHKLGLCTPTANFKLSSTQGCVPLTIKFTDLSTGSPTRYEWDFGNGNKSTLQNPSAIYYASGKFTITLSVWDASGNKSVKTFNPVKVFINPTANFSADTVACLGQAIKFKDLSTKGDTAVTQWSWDFGDGQIGGAQNPSHTYGFSGKYSIGLTVTDGYGCKSSATKTNYIRIKPAPVLDFNIDKPYGCTTPHKIFVLNKSSGATNYSWTCSDGSTGSSKDFYITLNSFGKYSVTLSATSGGCTSILTKNTIIVEKLTPNFNIPSTNLCEGSTISFENLSKPDNNVLSYLWEFGDGQTSTDKNPKHRYDIPEKYSVKLTISGGGCTENITKEIIVNPKPEVTVEVIDWIGCLPPFKAQFYVYGNDFVATKWNFGDESLLEVYKKESKIEHIYKEKGSFEVQYIVTNAFGCADTNIIEKKIEVNFSELSIEPSKLEGCIPLKQIYTATLNTDEKIVSYLWQFSDSVSADYTEKSVLKTFYREGFWGVKLTVKTENGCVIKDSVLVSVGKKFKPLFRISRKDICNKDSFYFKNLTPDSIKRKKFTTFQIISSNKNFKSKIERIKDTTYRITSSGGGKFYISLNVKHYGCTNTSSYMDSINVHGPFPKLKLKWLDCENKKALITLSKKWSNKDSLFLNDSFLNYKKTYIYLPKKIKPDTFIYTLYNDTFGCKDTAMLFPKPNNPFKRGVLSNISSICAPTTIDLSHSGKLKNAKWIFPDGTISKNLESSLKVNSPGKIKILLVGNFPKEYCPDTSFKDTSIFNFNVEGVPIKSSINASGKCMPISLSLYDSTAGNDDNEHKWVINGNEIFTTQLLTSYTIDAIQASGDTSINIRHIVTSNNGCISEKNYALPFAGPKIKYKLFRFFSCDTTAHYFEAIIQDSANTRFPLTYKWKFDDGTQYNVPKFKAMLGKVGMNYFTITVKDAYNCVSTYLDSLEVSPNMLQPLFYSNPIGSFCPPLRCKFYDQSKTFNSDIASWEWNFGDGTGSRLQYPEKLYLVPGKYDITLKIKSKSGCTATLKKPGYIIVNGPRGIYDFDRGNACLPHTVEFRGKALDSATMEWDFGDGVVHQGNNIKHIYNKRGRYIPAMILSDTLGCKYPLPPIDTIEIFDYPNAILNINGLCFNDLLRVKNATISNHEDSIVKTTWYYNQKIQNPIQNKFYKPEKRGWNEIKIIVENKGTCKDTVTKTIRIFAPIANFKPSEPLVCLGNPLSFINQSSSDTVIKYYNWQFGDNNTSIAKDPIHIYYRPRQYNVTLVAIDALNCADTAFKPLIANVGDTLLPPLVPIRRASVLNNKTVELVISKFPTFDFKKYIIFKEVNGKYLRTAEVTNVNDTVFLDRFCNTLNQSYCYKIATQNLCLKTSNEMQTPQHCTIENKALGQFEQNKITWSPYIGFDSILHYEIWRQDYNNPSAFQYINKVQGNINTYTDTLLTCYTRQNYKIIAQQYLGFSEKSHSDTATAKPNTINTTLPNYAWQATVENNDYAHIEWLNNAWSRNGMKAYLLTKQTNQGNILFKDKYFNLLDTVFNDQKTNVQSHSYIYTIKGIDMCNDTTPVSNVAQTILLKGYFDENTQKPALRWNHYQKWSQSIAYYEIEQKQLDGTFKWIGKVAPTDSSFIDINAQSNCTPSYEYRVRAISDINTLLKKSTFSLSNQVKVLPTSTLFIPNAFSPNRNGINENYGPAGQYIHKYHLEIYNRWGEKLFETTNCMEQWNGKFKDKECEQEVYLYHLSAMGADNKQYNLKGTFHLLQ